MGLVVVTLLVALLVGRAAGGSLAGLGALRVRRRRLVVAALVVQVVGVLVGGPVHAVALLVSTALAAAFLLANRGVRGTGLVALGFAANALVVTLNGAMPVSSAAVERAGGSYVDSARHEPVDDVTRLPLLADVVPVPLPLRPEVVSAGDVLVTAGLAQLVVAAMLGARTPQGRHRPARVRRGLPPLPAARTVRRAPARPRRSLPPLPATTRRAPAPAAPPGARS